MERLLNMSTVTPVTFIFPVMFLLGFSCYSKVIVWDETMLV
jgi:hypothetical protein